MNIPCDDRDLLSIEPRVFLDTGLTSQQLISGDDAALDGTSLTSSGSDFTSAAVTAGMVITTYATLPAEGVALEVLSVDSATELTVSALRADPAADAIPPEALGGANFLIRSFAPQRRTTWLALSEALRRASEAAGIAAADFADSQQLRLTVAYGTLAAIFAARADHTRAEDANWIKAEHYRREFHRLRPQLRLTVDEDGDGVAEQTRALGNVTLRRV